MVLKSHIIAGVIGTAVFFPFLGWFNAIIFFVSSILIDADHYLDYLWKTKGDDWRPKSMFKYYHRLMNHGPDKEHLGFSLLHTIELYVVIYLLAVSVNYGFLNYTFFLTILGGMSYHIIMDVISMAYKGEPFARAFSIFEYHVRKRSMKKKGLHPQNFFMRMYELSKKD